MRLLESSIEFIINWVYYDFLEKVYENAMMIELNFGTKPEVKRKAFDNLRK